MLKVFTLHNKVYVQHVLLNAIGLRHLAQVQDRWELFHLCAVHTFSCRSVLEPIT